MKRGKTLMRSPVRMPRPVGATHHVPTATSAGERPSQARLVAPAGGGERASHRVRPWRAVYSIGELSSVRRLEGPESRPPRIEGRAIERVSRRAWASGPCVPPRGRVRRDSEDRCPTGRTSVRGVAKRRAVCPSGDRRASADRPKGGAPPATDGMRKTSGKLGIQALRR